jgi:hypothetical protein
MFSGESLRIYKKSTSPKYLFFILHQQALQTINILLSCHTYQKDFKFASSLTITNMRTSTTAFALLSILGLSAAAPTPVELAPRCGTTVYPTILQQLTEGTPFANNPNTLSTTSNFHVSQTVGSDGKITNRVYQVVGFQGIPAGAYACQLNVKFDPTYPITSVGNPTLNVTTLYNGSPSNIVYPNDYTWNKFFSATSPPASQGLFGTVTLAPGQNAAINSETCAGNLAFVFSIASWVSQTASVDFTEYINKLNGAGLNGVYLTHSC